MKITSFDRLAHAIDAYECQKEHITCSVVYRLFLMMRSVAGFFEQNNEVASVATLMGL